MTNRTVSVPARLINKIARPSEIRPGMKFGRLTVVGLSDYRNPKQRGCYWDCRCVCGGKKLAYASYLFRDRTKDCGCERTNIAKRTFTKHGYCANKQTTKEYQAWARMIKRCHNKKCKDFKWYGGRGISVHDEWVKSFEAFLKYVGHAPTAEHSIDRINNNGNYEPGNVRWATCLQQRQNMRSNRKITIAGETRCMSEWCRIIGISHKTFYRRIENGWSEVDALTVPTHTNKNNPSKYIKGRW